MLLEQYAQTIHTAIDRICLEEKIKITQAAQLVQNVLANDGIIYVFGCGHSHMLAEETFYRAGGLVNVAPVLFPPLMLHEGAAQSSVLEKQPDLAKEVLAQYPITKNDLFFCLSTSGINAVCVEAAQQILDQGIPVVSIVSSAYFDQPSRSPNHKHLHEVSTVYLDNKAPYGDACLHPQGAQVGMTPLSTVTGAFIINSILAEGAELALANHVDVPIYLSGNIEGGTQRNQALIERFQPRIKHL